MPRKRVFVPDETCMIEGCPSKRAVRGLCSYHYKMVLETVRKGKNTWSDFEQAGMCAPAKSISRKEKETLFRRALSKKMKR